MVIVRSSLPNPSGVPHNSMSVVLDNGDTQIFFPFPDGVHHSFTRRFRGQYEEAVANKLRRPHAEIGMHHDALGEPAEPS
ncbi:MAG: hypothetical protein EXR43_03575 [Dehalococcoidia bacterium]|nr:hypothetical protein [Dehalococcoidia bacterium]